MLHITSLSVIVFIMLHSLHFTAGSWCPMVQVLKDGGYQDVLNCGSVMVEYDAGNITQYAPHFSDPSDITFKWWDGSNSTTSYYQFRYTQVLISSQSNTVTLASFSTEVSLPSSGTVPKLQTLFSVGISCTTRATVGLLLAFTFETNNSSSGTGVNVGSVNIQTLEFVITWECYTPGCSNNCSNHGTCHNLLGQCECNEPWSGYQCGMQLQMETTLCPQQRLNMTYFLPATSYEIFYSSLWAWYSISQGDRQVDWRYLYSWSELLELEGTMSDDFNVSGKHVIPAHFPPGDYTLTIETFGESNDDLVILSSAIHVQDWTSCGYENVSCVEGLSNQCSGHGFCYETACICEMGRFWYDCSRGCSNLVELHEPSGVIQSDYPAEGLYMAYAPNSYCAWLISPQGDYDTITFTFTTFSIEGSDGLNIRLSDENATYGELVSILSGSSAAPVIAHSKHVLLLFVTDFATSGVGFVVEYKCSKSESVMVIWLPFVLFIAVVFLILVSIALFLLRRLKRMAKVNDELQQENVQLQSVLGQQVSVGDLLSTPAESVVRTLTTLRECIPAKEVHKLEYAIGIITSRKMYSIDYSHVSELENDIKEYLYDQVLTKNTSSAMPTPFIGRNNLSQHGECDPTLLQQINNWDFCPLGIEGPVLAQTAAYILHSCAVLHSLPISVTQLSNYISAADQAYNDNPYHNRFHACEVLQAMNWFLTKCGSYLQLTPIEHFSALFAAIIHDIQHPGVNNNFLIATRSKLSITYNDISILENFHACTAFQLLEQPDLNFTTSFSKEMFREFRTLVINLVLATDMSRHVELLGMWKSSTASGNTLKFGDNASRLLALKLFIKCADLANSAREWKTSEQWAHRVVNEFFEQGDKEQGFGLPVSPFMKRDDCNIPKMQSAFNELVVCPLYDSMHKVFPEMEEPVQKLHKNLGLWGCSGVATPKSTKSV